MLLTHTPAQTHLVNVPALGIIKGRNLKAHFHILSGAKACPPPPSQTVVVLPSLIPSQTKRRILNRQRSSRSRYVCVCVCECGYVCVRVCI